MKWKLAGISGLLALLVADMHAPPADACGIKLVIKTQTPRKAVARSSNPSHLLLLGTPPHRLERELSAAGHDVEVAPTIAAAKQSSYNVVVVDPQHADEAKAKFPTAMIVVRSGDVTADVSSVEARVARKPVSKSETPTLVATGGDRGRLVASGPPQGAQVNKGPSPSEAATPPAAAETPPPKVAVAPKPPPAETPPAPRPAAAAPKPPPAEVPPPKVAVTPKAPTVEAPQPNAAPPPATRPVAVRPSRDEVYFGYNSANFGNRHTALDRAVTWLTKDTDVHVVIEGHADPSGTHDANQKLGQSRAESVRDYLAANGIEEARMEVISYGDTRLKYGRTDPRNRRVAIVPKK